MKCSTGFFFDIFEFFHANMILTNSFSFLILKSSLAPQITVSFPQLNLNIGTLVDKFISNADNFVSLQFHQCLPFRH
jgi:hypothetical protein